ncbi:MAG TPA: HD domain-containing protein [Solirubrobacteraceae bacterium]|nr:HD domain-containing protein [Solirubrobacteraceae bacterium]
MSRDPLVVLRDLGVEGYLVGGAVRDRLLGRATLDYDVALPRESREVARQLARLADAHAFELSEGFGVWRVVARDHSWQLDTLPLQGGEIESDLAARDLTVNAIAESLRGGELIDPFGGQGDLKARRLRMVSPGAFAADPLRILRLVRLACELGFEAEAGTVAAATASVPELARVSPERVFAEFKRIVACDRAVDGLALLDELGATAVVLPELSALRGVEQSHYHDLDVHEHTRAVLAATIELQRAPGDHLGAHAAELDSFLTEPLANELTRWEAMRFGALFHDIAKPQTRAITAEGRITFMGHDVAGAEMAAAVLGRLRASQRLCEHVAALARHHLRLGFLVHQMPLPKRAVYRYLRTCEPVEIDVTVLSIADRLATRGSGSERAIERHLELARELLDAGLRWQAERPRPPLRGDELTRELGLRPGPQVGEILQELEEAAYAGEINSRQQALEKARELTGSP